MKERGLGLDKKKQEIIILTVTVLAIRSRGAARETIFIWDSRSEFEIINPSASVRARILIQWEYSTVHTY